MSHGKINVKQVDGLLPIESGGTNNNSFTFSQIVIASTASLVTSGYIFNDSGTSSTDIWSAKQVILSITSSSNTTVSGGRDANATNSYLRGTDSQFMNTSPYILPYNATLTYISASTEVSETWIAEVHTSSVVVTGATLSMSATTSGYGTYSINFNAGDKVMLYCKGSSISHPRVDIIFRKR